MQMYADFKQQEGGVERGRGEASLVSLEIYRIYIYIYIYEEFRCKSL